MPKDQLDSLWRKEFLIFATRDLQAVDNILFGLFQSERSKVVADGNALAELGLLDIPAISLAKKEELVYLTEKEGPVDLPARSPTLQLLQRIRDEAHRFAITYQRQRRTWRTFRSTLDDIPGIGPKRSERLLKHFAGLHEIKEASVEELAAVPGIDRSTARRIFAYFHPKKSKNYI